MYLLYLTNLIEKWAKTLFSAVGSLFSDSLLELLIDYEDDVLRFMEKPGVLFASIRGENDIRLTKGSTENIV